MDFQQQKFDQAERYKTFSFLTWCGLSNSLNPRKLSRLGFINVGDNQIQCVDCEILITLKSHLNFSNDNILAERMLNRIKESHNKECIFKQEQEYKSQNQKGNRVKSLEVSKYFNSKQLLKSQNSEILILDRKISTLYWSQLLGSFFSINQNQELLPEININCIQHLTNFTKDDNKTSIKACLLKLSQRLLDLQNDDSISIALILSIYGWRIINSSSNKRILKCCYCNKQLQLNQFTLTTLKCMKIEDQQNLTQQSQLQQFNPLKSHYKFCFNFPESKPRKQEPYKLTLELLSKKYIQDENFTYLVSKIQQQQKLLTLEQSSNLPINNLEYSSLSQNKPSKVIDILREDLLAQISDKIKVQSVVDQQLKKVHEEDKIIKSEDNEEQQDSQAENLSFSLLGKRKQRSFQEIDDMSQYTLIRQVKDQLESSSKRLKAIHQQQNDLKDFLNRLKNQQVQVQQN